MKESNLEHWGNSEIKYSIYFKIQPVGRGKKSELGPRRKKRYFLRETPQPGNRSIEVRITSAQYAEFREIRAESITALTEAQIAWAQTAIIAGKRPQGIVFTPRRLHSEEVE